MLRVLSAMVPWLVLLALLLVLLAIPAVIRSRRRRKLMREWEAEHGSRLILMIHRERGMLTSLVRGGGMIGQSEAETMVAAVRDTAPDKPIDLLLHTPGGVVFSATQIARALRLHPAGVRVIVPHYAMSGGTLLSLAAGEIVMDKHAALGPVDPQLLKFPSMLAMASVLRVIREKSSDEIDDETWILADQAEKAIREIADTIAWLVEPRLGAQKGRELGQMFTEGRWTHAFPLTADDLTGMGLTVSTAVPEAAYELLDSYGGVGKAKSVHLLD